MLLSALLLASALGGCVDSPASVSPETKHEASDEHIIKLPEDEDKIPDEERDLSENSQEEAKDDDGIIVDVASEEDGDASDNDKAEPTDPEAADKEQILTASVPDADDEDQKPIATVPDAPTIPAEDIPYPIPPTGTGIDVDIDVSIPLPEISIDNLSAEEMVIYFGIDIRGIDAQSFEELTHEQRMMVSNLKEQLRDNFAPEELSKLDEMTLPELLDFVVKRGEFVYTMAKLLESSDIILTLDGFSGEVSLDSTLLFGFDERELSDEGKKTIYEFVGLCSAVILNERFTDILCEVAIEGHTDTQSSYEYNMALSEDRAKSVLECCLAPETGINDAAREKLRSILTAKGCSYDRPILNSDGTVNMEASRRVSFRFIFGID